MVVALFATASSAAATDDTPRGRVSPEAPAPAPDDAAAQQPVPPVTVASSAARQVLDRVRPAIIQIKGFFGTNTSEAFHGTGFAAARGGIFVTNWHVVSDAVLYPEKYRLEYQTSAGTTGRLNVHAIDVRHDLAIVEAVGFAPSPLELWPEAKKGERAYSIGFPLDVGLTITEGVNNGRVEDSFEPRIHYSGALNAGMSGGPGLDAAGRVIGVNVAVNFQSQLVAFFVPAEYAIALLSSSTGKPLDAKRVNEEIADQLRAHSDALLAALDTPLPRQNDQGYELPAKPAGFFVCGAAGDPAPDQPIQIERFYCDANATLYVASDIRSGGLWFRHSILHSTTLDAWRFAHRLQAISTLPSGKIGSGRNRQLAPYACKQNDLALDGLQVSAIVCLRAYRRFEGLYDLNVHIVSKNEPRRAFVSTLSLTGVSSEAGLAFAKLYLAAIGWKP